MNVAALSSRNALISTLGLLDPSATDTTETASATWFTDQTNASDSTDSTDSGVSASATSFSQTATLLSTLSSLSTQDPTAFKEKAKEISADLRKAADSSSDAMTSYSLSAMADQFSNAGLTGSVNSLAPASSSTAAPSRLKGYASAVANSTSLFSTSLTGDGSSGLRDQINAIISQNLSGASDSASA